MASLPPPGADPAAAIATSQLFAYVIMVLAGTVLLVTLYRYGTYVLAVRRARRNLWYFAVGTVAAIVFGVTGALDQALGHERIALVSEGATVFFIMFFALGFRALYLSAPPVGREGAVERAWTGLFHRYFPAWLDSLIIGGYIVGWLIAVLFAPQFRAVVVAVGWVLASGWALVWAILLVTRHEGTSLASLTRHLFPAILAFTGTIVVDLAGRYVGGWDHVVAATWVVGPLLVAGFLLSAAIALRQESGEVERIYDWTTYRGEHLDEDTSDS